MRNFRVSFALGFARFSTLTAIAIFAHVAPLHQVVSNSGTYRLSKIEQSVVVRRTDEKYLFFRWKQHGEPGWYPYNSRWVRSAS